ncbi:hypothetical protein L218DRAFT_983941 [Marasmius fiardii PR-910]|nr:hypothetical protein L218DRAFT_983941 [Marasmius fiardii PR-910]
MVVNPEPSAITTLRRHPHYYIETIIFEVDDTLFRIPSRYLFEKSDVLRAASEISSFTTEGTSDATPAKLPLPGDATIDDFESFVKAIYPMTIDLPAPTCFSKVQWISVLKLSTCWMFDDLRRLAVNQITACSPSPSEKILLGRKYKVKRWLLEGLRQLSERSSTLVPLDELASLGEGTAMRLLYIRNSPPVYHGCTTLQADILSSGRSYCTSCGNYYTNHPTEKPKEPISVEELFSSELNGLSDEL